jgi:hypothetical protein
VTRAGLAGNRSIDPQLLLCSLRLTVQTVYQSSLHSAFLMRFTENEMKRILILRIPRNSAYTISHYLVGYNNVYVTASVGHATSIFKVEGLANTKQVATRNLSHPEEFCTLASCWFWFGFFTSWIVWVLSAHN